MPTSSKEITPVPNGLKCLLPKDFEPSDFDFVIGRGKQIKQLPGNQRLSKLIHSVADDYTSGDKARKSFLLSQLVKQVYEKSPQAGFVKKDPVSGRWYAVEEALARTSAAQAVRDCLCTHYKSSRQFKQKRRHQAKKEQVPVQHIPCSAVLLTDVEESPATPSPYSMNGMMTAKVSPGPSDFATMSLSSLPGFRRCVTDGSSSARPMVCLSSPASPMPLKKDLFSVLMANFGPQNNTMADPFEPVPIKEEPQPRLHQMSAQERLSSILDSALDLDGLDFGSSPQEPAFVDSMFSEV